MTLARTVRRTALPVLPVAVVAAAVGLGVPGPAVAAAPPAVQASWQQAGASLLRVGSHGLVVREWQDLMNRAFTGGTVDHPVLTVDGVYQGPGGPDEDRRGGFDRGGWNTAHADDDMWPYLVSMFERADALLLGRKT